MTGLSKKPKANDDREMREALDLLDEAESAPSWDSFSAPSIVALSREPLPLPQHVGRYRILRRLGIGGMAEVLLGEQSGPGGFAKKVVIKRLLPHLAIDASFVELFLREARIAARLSHPNVVQVYELGEADGQYFIAMEFIDGLTVYQLAKRLWGAGKSLPLEVSLRAIADAALGLHHAHELRGTDGLPLGIVHRDISPDNLMITREGLTKVLDFGIAKPALAETLTRHGELKGKIPFMAPEMLRGGAIDRRADLYALGVSLYWLLTGRRPYRADSDYMTIDLVLRTECAPPSTLVATVPAEIDDLVMRLLAKDPAQRLQTGAELHRMLSQGLAIDTALDQCVVESALELPDRALHEIDDPCDAPISTASPTYQHLVTPQETPAPPRSSRRSLAVAAGIAVIATLAVGAGVSAFLAPRTVTPVTVRAPVTLPVVAVAPVVVPPPAVEPAPIVVEEPRVRATAKATSLHVTAPARIVWRTERGNELGRGSGTLSVPAGLTRIVAVDPARQVSTRVGVGKPVDYAKLPQGTLEVRAFPFAEVWLGTEKLGTTPIPAREVVAGTYKIKLTYEGVVVTKTVEVGAGRIERVTAKMIER